MGRGVLTSGGGSAGMSGMKEYNVRFTSTPALILKADKIDYSTETRCIILRSAEGKCLALFPMEHVIGVVQKDTIQG